MAGPKDVHDLDTQTEAGGDRELGAGENRVYLLVRCLDQASAVEILPGRAVTLGRGRECDVLLDDVKASRVHCAVSRHPHGLVVRDLDSRNGTWLRGKRLPAAEVTLAAGDVLSVGAVEIVVAFAAMAPEQRGAPAKPEAADQSALDLGETIVADAATVGIYRTAKRIAATPATVLVLGETGSGKEVLAEQIHRWSPRVGKPFIGVNCAALPEPLLESELFGHERGAFTGADRRKQGLFEAAHMGTLLLDELGELSLTTQAKLLRALETKTVQPLGSTRTVNVDVRIVGATHKDLQAAVREGTFREDFYYRISTFALKLPPLRERPAELALLTERFIAMFAARQGTKPPALSPKASAHLKAYRWPGNIRELRNAIEHAVVLCEHGLIEVIHLPAQLCQSPNRAGVSLGVKDELEEIERVRIGDALALHAGNRTHAALALGISRRTLIYKLHKYGLA